MPPHRNRQQKLSGRAVTVDHTGAVQGHPDAALRVDRRAVRELVLWVNMNENRRKTKHTYVELLANCNHLFRETLNWKKNSVGYFFQ